MSLVEICNYKACRSFGVDFKFLVAICMDPYCRKFPSPPPTWLTQYSFFYLSDFTRKFYLLAFVKTNRLCLCKTTLT